MLAIFHKPYNAWGISAVGVVDGACGRSAAEKMRVRAASITTAFIRSLILLGRSLTPAKKVEGAE
jgi:hypothetical protein